MNYLIVPLSKSHFIGLHKALDVVAKEHKYLAFLQAPPFKLAKKFYENIVANDLCHFVALQNDNVIGWCDILPVIGESQAHAGILGIGLLPEVRHNGIGTKLLQAAISKAATKKISRIELTVRADNIFAKKLYERFEFKTEGIKHRSNFIDGQYYDSYLMALLLQ